MEYLRFQFPPKRPNFPIIRTQESKVDVQSFMSYCCLAMVAYALLGFRVQLSVLFPRPINDVGNYLVDNIIKKRLAQEAVAMSEHIINIDWIYYMSNEKGLL